MIHLNEQLKQRVLDYLESYCVGREHATPKHRIMDALKIDSERIFRQCVHQLRIEENAILSTSEPPAGYFIPIEIGEVDETMQQFKNRAINQGRACAGIRRGLQKKFPGSQIQLDLPDSA